MNEWHIYVFKQTTERMCWAKIIRFALWFPIDCFRFGWKFEQFINNQRTFALNSISNNKKIAHVFKCFVRIFRLSISLWFCFCLFFVVCTMKFKTPSWRPYFVCFRIHQICALHQYSDWVLRSWWLLLLFHFLFPPLSKCAAAAAFFMCVQLLIFASVSSFSLRLISVA